MFRSVYRTSLLFLVFLLAGGASYPISVNSTTQERKFENWILARCIGRITKDKSLQDDAFRSASAWLEFSKLPVEAFNEADVLIDDKLKEHLTGAVPGSYDVMKCTVIFSGKRSGFHL